MPVTDTYSFVPTADDDTRDVPTVAGSEWHDALLGSCTCVEGRIGLCGRCMAELGRTERQAPDRFERAVPPPKETR